MIRASFFLAAVLAITLAAGRANGQSVSATAPKISAHRGTSRIAPENTLMAFSAAMKSGADFIELDVRTTLDGREVCLHDASLKRTTGFDSGVRDVAYKKIKTLTTLYSSGASYASGRIPSLEEVCQLVEEWNTSGMKTVNLYVDCKDIVVPQVVTILRRYTLMDSAVFYGDALTLRAIREMAPQARLLPAYPGPAKEDEVIRDLRPYAFDVSWKELNSALVNRCHQKGIKIFCDLLDEHDNGTCYLKAMNDGVDLIQTDDVEGVKQTIAAFQHHITE
jgi:glycerophosphoryl diester phosphodiesterase